MTPALPELPQEAILALRDLPGRMRALLGTRLLALYLYGSAVWGDFDAGISDLDLLAVVAAPIITDDLPALEALHTGFVAEFPEWADRVEVQYFTPEGLMHFRERATSMANISPGEPLHIIQSGHDWLSNWYFVQNYGVTLFGPPPSAFIPHIEDEEFLGTVRWYAEYWRTHIADTRDSLPSQAYAIMTVCRAAYTLATGEQVSKHKAAQWQAQQSPQDANLIADAFRWRANFREHQPDIQANYPRTEEFVLRTIQSLPA